MSEENETTIELLAHEVRTQHAELCRLLNTVRQQLSACTEKGHARPGPCLTATMKQLKDHLEAHFAREESGGWLEEAVVRAPHLAHQLTRLEQQHEPLRARAANLVAEAEASDKTAASIDQLRHHFEMFAHHLTTHESHEERVLQKGFNEDLELT